MIWGLAIVRGRVKMYGVIRREGFFRLPSHERKKILTAITNALKN